MDLASCEEEEEEEEEVEEEKVEEEEEEEEEKEYECGRYEWVWLLLYDALLSVFAVCACDVCPVETEVEEEVEREAQEEVEKETAVVGEETMVEILECLADRGES